MADLESIIADMREYGTAGIDAYLGPHHMALCLKQQANIWADQLAALSHAAGHEADKGPWKVGKDGRDVFSDDFGVDAALRISGDFHDDDHLARYAKWLCNKLNDTPPTNAEVGRD